jgi:hypothetical protein
VRSNGSASAAPGTWPGTDTGARQSATGGFVDPRLLALAQDGWAGAHLACPDGVTLFREPATVGSPQRGELLAERRLRDMKHVGGLGRLPMSTI